MSLTRKRTSQAVDICSTTLLVAIRNISGFTTQLPEITDFYLFAKHSFFVEPIFTVLMFSMSPNRYLRTNLSKSVTTNEFVSILNTRSKKRFQTSRSVTCCFYSLVSLRNQARSQPLPLIGLNNGGQLANRSKICPRDGLLGRSRTPQDQRRRLAGRQGMGKSTG